jgi:uncharacterized membrane protein
MQLEPKTIFSRLGGTAFRTPITIPSSVVPISLAAILILAVVLRFLGLGDESLWGDETHTAVRIQDSWWTLLTKPIDNNQPLHFVLLKAWTAIAGHSEAALRFPSAVFGILTVWMTFILGRRLANDWVGLGAALVVAILPTMIWYSQETRTYAMQSFFAVTSLYLLVRYFEEGRPVHIVGYCVAAILGIYTHFYFGLYILGNFAAGTAWLAMFRKRGAWQPFMFGHVAVGASLLVRIPVLLDYIEADYSGAFTVAPSIVLKTLFVQLGFTVPRHSAATTVPVIDWLVLSLIAVSAISIALNPRQKMMFPAVVSVTATIVLLGAGIVADVPIVGRYLLPTIPLLLIMAAHGVYTLVALVPKRRELVAIPVAAVAALFLLAVGANQWVQARELVTREDWRGIAKFVDQRAESGDKLVFDGWLSRRSVGYYSKRNLDAVMLASSGTWPCQKGEAMWLVARPNNQMKSDIEDRADSCNVALEESWPLNWGLWRLTPNGQGQASPPPG